MATVYAITVEDNTEEPSETLIVRVGLNDGGTFDVEGSMTSGETEDTATVALGIESLDDAIKCAVQTVFNILTIEVDDDSDTSNI